jgi:AbrB family looped-hinge helix DNA binding protein
MAISLADYRGIRATRWFGPSVARKTMALYRTLYYGDMTVGVGGRVTIPQEIRDDLGLGDGDLMTVRVEESPDGTRQMVMWRAKEQREDAEE